MDVDGRSCRISPPKDGAESFRWGGGAATLPDLVDGLEREGRVASLRTRSGAGGVFLVASWLDLTAHRYAISDSDRMTIAFFLDGGEIRLESGEAAVAGGAGSTALITPGSRAAWSCDGFMKYLQVGIPALPESAGQPPILLRHASDDYVLRRLGLALAGLLEREDEFDSAEAWAWCTILESRLASHCANVAATPGNAAVARPGGVDMSVVLQFVEQNLHERLTVPQLAALCGRSRVGFARAFRDAVGLSPHRYIVERRVAKARRLLEATRRPLTEVAYAAGFSSQSHLTSTFRRYVGTTPRAYREHRGGSWR